MTSVFSYETEETKSQEFKAVPSAGSGFSMCAPLQGTRFAPITETLFNPQFVFFKTNALQI